MVKKLKPEVPAPSAEPVEMPASAVKNEWHEVLDRVSRVREAIVITRYGKPVARLSPIESDPATGGIFGWLAGDVHVAGDIIAPTGARWEADE